MALKKGWDKTSTFSSVYLWDPCWRLKLCCLPFWALNPDQGGACRARWIAVWSRAAGVNHMNVLPELIGSGKAERARRPRHAAQSCAPTSKALPEGGRGEGGGGGIVEEVREESEQGPGRALQRPFWLMSALIYSTLALDDDVIVDLQAKSTPIQIKVEVSPVHSLELFTRTGWLSANTVFR